MFYFIKGETILEINLPAHISIPSTVTLINPIRQVQSDINCDPTIDTLLLGQLEHIVSLGRAYWFTTHTTLIKGHRISRHDLQLIICQ